MAPEQDSQGRENDGQYEKSEPENRPEKDRPESNPNSRDPGKSSATELGKRVRTVGSLGMIPILLAAGPIIGIFIGQWLDKKFDSSPWLTVLFVILGFVAGVREMIRLLKRESTKEDKKER
jgi:ATP synthase protein I